VPWHDRLLGVLRGVEPAEALVSAVYTPEMRGELALAAWLVGGEAALRAMPPLDGFASRPVAPSALGAALLDALRAPADQAVEPPQELP
jgi:hypothetical protein